MKTKKLAFNKAMSMLMDLPNIVKNEKAKELADEIDKNIVRVSGRADASIQIVSGSYTSYYVPPVGNYQDTPVKEKELDGPVKVVCSVQYAGDIEYKYGTFSTAFNKIVGDL